jgi:protein-S-isoprenylcysteine O-methyltransferase Ste14
MPAYGYAILAAAWLLWFTPFVLAQKRERQKARVVDRRARWGMLLMAVSYALLWQGKFWLQPLTAWRLGLGIFFLTLGCLLSWTSTRALGQQWRLDAGLNSNHQLVRSGPYRFVRHPVYASMFAILLGTGSFLTSKCLFIAAVIVFIAGAEVRVRVEDHLLDSQFGDEFQKYRQAFQLMYHS